MAGYFYSPSQHTFLVEGLHTHRPDDCVQVSYQDYSELLKLQSEGFQIVFDASSGKPTALPFPSLSMAEQCADLHQNKVMEINTACEAEITSGFWSAALGESHRYSSQLDDQLNLTGVILQGLDNLYACRDLRGVKEFRPHTAKQLRQVGDDFTMFKLQLLQKANGLKQQLDQSLATGDLADIKAVVWEVLE